MHYINWNLTLSIFVLCLVNVNWSNCQSNSHSFGRRVRKNGILLRGQNRRRDATSTLYGAPSIENNNQYEQKQSQGQPILQLTGTLYFIPHGSQSSLAFKTDSPSPSARRFQPINGLQLPKKTNNLGLPNSRTVSITQNYQSPSESSSLSSEASGNRNQINIQDLSNQYGLPDSSGNANYQVPPPQQQEQSPPQYQAPPPRPKVQNQYGPPTSTAASFEQQQQYGAPSSEIQVPNNSYGIPFNDAQSSTNSNNNINRPNSEYGLPSQSIGNVLQQYAAPSPNPEGGYSNGNNQGYGYNRGDRSNKCTVYPYQKNLKECIKDRMLNPGKYHDESIIPPVWPNKPITSTTTISPPLASPDTTTQPTLSPSGFDANSDPELNNFPSFDTDTDPSILDDLGF